MGLDGADGLTRLAPHVVQLQVCHLLVRAAFTFLGSPEVFALLGCSKLVRTNVGHPESWLTIHGCGSKMGT